MPDPARTLVWIVSYPKSGNTWVRLLTCNLVFGPQQSAAALSQLVPDIHELGSVPELPAGPVLMKTHFPLSPALPLLQQTAGAIYVVRNPADVIVSNFHYARRSRVGLTDGEGVWERYVDDYLSAHGDPHWIALRMGAWDDHVRSWVAASQPFPVLLLRYEDLLADCTAGAHRICAFLGLTRTAGEIEQAVAGASFRRMREMEESDIRDHSVGIFYKPYLQGNIDAGLRFMRSGRAGEGAWVLSTEQQLRVHTAFGPVMRDLGYATVS